MPLRWDGSLIELLGPSPRTVGEIGLCSFVVAFVVVSILHVRIVRRESGAYPTQDSKILYKEC